MHRSPPVRAGSLIATLVVMSQVSPAPLAGQFDDVPIPQELAALDFMIGEWTVAGAFRTPDLIGEDRRLWYAVGEDGVTAFDGAAWTAFEAGSRTADSIRARIRGRAEPYRFVNDMTVSRIQDGFVLMIDEGRTSGTTLVHFDATANELVSTALHAPTSGVTKSVATPTDGPPIFTGRGADRRGERIFRRHYQLVGPDEFRIRTDISFDDGVTWIEDQIVQEVRRR